MISTLVSTGWSLPDWWSAAHQLWALRPRGCQEHLKVAVQTCVGLTPFGSEVEYIELVLLLSLILCAFLLGRVTATIELSQVIGWWRPPTVVYVGHGSDSRFSEEAVGGGPHPAGVHRRARVARADRHGHRAGHDGDDPHARRGPLFGGPECN